VPWLTLVISPSYRLRHSLADLEVKELDPGRTGKVLLTLIEEAPHMLLALVLMERVPIQVQFVEDARTRVLDGVAGVDERPGLALLDEPNCLGHERIELLVCSVVQIESHHQSEHVTLLPSDLRTGDYLS